MLHWRRSILNHPPLCNHITTPPTAHCMFHDALLGISTVRRLGRDAEVGENAGFHKVSWQEPRKEAHLQWDKEFFELFNENNHVVPTLQE